MRLEKNENTGHQPPPNVLTSKALNKTRVVSLALLLVAVLFTYANYFENDFHFDDSHTVEENPSIRSLHNLPKFFADATTFSILPTNQSYRPVVSASLALDYWLGGGLDPFFFRLSTICWFLLQLILMFLLFNRVLDLSRPTEFNGTAALLSVAWFGLHPVSAETVNYIIQRGELYAALGVVAGLTIYAYVPRSRKWGAYLLPVVIGALAKPTALMFAPIFFFYRLLYSENAGFCFWHRSFSWAPVRAALKESALAFAICGVLYLLQSALTPETFAPGGASTVKYVITQPFVHLYYLGTLLVPNQLSIDTDWTTFSNAFEPNAIKGYLFYMGLGAAIFWTSGHAALRTICFGLVWFVIALIPTTVVPLSEVMNTHRMYLPFVGIALAVAAALQLVLDRTQTSPSRFRLWVRGLIFGLIIIALPTYAHETFTRNAIWRSEESLWLDATLKSPNNGRAFMNYGLTQMKRGNFTKAIENFRKAEQLAPNYSLPKINLGIAYGALGNAEKAEQYFQRGIALNPQSSVSYYFYARWLNSRGLKQSALRHAWFAIERGPQDFRPRHLYLQILSEVQDWEPLKAMAQEMLSVNPSDPLALYYLRKAEIAAMKQAAPARERNSPATQVAALITVSLELYQAKKFEESINASREALALDRKSTVALNNIAAASAMLGRWRDAIDAARAALEIDPEFELAKNNLAWAETEFLAASATNP